MVRLSIIIPVYNVEQYLKQCLESVISQNIPYVDYEIIIVNDGSTDSSLAITNSYADKHKNIVVISQNNQGLSAARNVGIETASGDYIWFVDSDDFIAKDCLKDILEILYINHLDGLRIKSARYIDGEFMYDNVDIMDGIVTGQDCLKNHKSYREAVWMTIYKREFLIKNNIKFFVGKIHEDTEFTPKAYYYLNRLFFYDKCVYFYRMNSSSLTNNYSLLFKRCIDLVDIAVAMRVFCISNVKDNFRSVYYTYIAFALNGAMELADNLDEYGKNRLTEKLRKESLLHLYIKSSEILLIIEGVLLLAFPSRCLSLYSLLRRIQKNILK